jgi:hypothetical protein
MTTLQNAYADLDQRHHPGCTLGGNQSLDVKGYYYCSTRVYTAVCIHVHSSVCVLNLVLYSTCR